MKKYLFFIMMDELSETEKVETENFVAKHANLKTEFELIGKAKLTPDSLSSLPG